MGIERESGSVRETCVSPVSTICLSIRFRSFLRFFKWSMISWSSSADFLRKPLSFSSFSSSSLRYRSIPGLARQGRLLVDFLQAVLDLGAGEIAVAGVEGLEPGNGALVLVDLLPSRIDQNDGPGRFGGAGGWNISFFHRFSIGRVGNFTPPNHLGRGRLASSITGLVNRMLRRILTRFSIASRYSLTQATSWKKRDLKRGRISVRVFVDLLFEESMYTRNLILQRQPNR
jgi:hypothetical protein